MTDMVSFFAPAVAAFPAVLGAMASCLAAVEITGAPRKGVGAIGRRARRKRAQAYREAALWVVVAFAMFTFAAIVAALA